MSRELLSAFHKQNSFQLGEFTLKSGVSSPIYVDLRMLISAPSILSYEQCLFPASNAIYKWREKSKLKTAGIYTTTQFYKITCKELYPNGANKSFKESAAEAICKIIEESEVEYDYIVGVPYGAIMLATLISVKLKKPMLLKRKEAKNYGKKQMIEGVFEPGKRALIVEDVVTSGASIMETIDELRKVDLICENVICVLNRQQGGELRLKSEDITLRSVITMSLILDYLEEKSEITAKRKSEICALLRNPLKATTEIKTVKNGENEEGKAESGEKSPEEICTTAPQQCGIVCEGDNALNNRDESVEENEDSEKWSLKGRKNYFAENKFNSKLYEIMCSKKTNLCLAIDFDNTVDILELVKKVKSYICAVKLHHDIIKDFNKEFVSELLQLSYDHHFIIFEDRKYADTGKTMELQLEGGLIPVADWADLVTVHSIAGTNSIEALQTVVDRDCSKLKSCLLIAELSTKNALTSLAGYTKETVKVAKQNPKLVSGFICQKRCHNDPSFLYWSPGVNLSKASDGKGQQWRSVTQAIGQDGCDIIIVGRGICEAVDPLTESRRYAEAAWESFSSR